MIWMTFEFSPSVKRTDHVHQWHRPFLIVRLSNKKGKIDLTTNGFMAIKIRYV